jgi:aryl-alcohol dehydrogenase-like predicted oxidoreductase
MRTRRLGKNGPEVSAVGMGCMGLSHAFGPPTPYDEAVKVIRAAYDAGYTFFDTAQVYTGINPDGTTSYNEEMVGEALRSVRDDVVIATKFGVSFTEHGLATDGTRDNMRRSVEGSLKHLGVERIDLYYQHRQDPDVPVEDVAGAMQELIEEGKIAAWGMSEVDADTIRRANAVCPVTAVENRYSMLARGFETIFPTLEELDITLVAFTPFSKGPPDGYVLEGCDVRPGARQPGPQPGVHRPVLRPERPSAAPGRRLGGGEGGDHGSDGPGVDAVQEAVDRPDPGVEEHHSAEGEHRRGRCRPDRRRGADARRCHRPAAEALVFRPFRCARLRRPGADHGVARNEPLRSASEAHCGCRRSTATAGPPRELRRGRRNTACARKSVSVFISGGVGRELVRSAGIDRYGWVSRGRPAAALSPPR